eukprot:9496775-Pyramimonas_sp.AAC.1
MHGPQGHESDSFPIWITSCAHRAGKRRRGMIPNDCRDQIDKHFIQETFEDAELADLEEYGASMFPDRHASYSQICGVALLRYSGKYTGALSESGKEARAISNW